MQNKTKLISLAAKYQIDVDFEAPFDSIELSAPEGKQFDTELHHLVTQRDSDNHESKDSHYARVTKDIQEYGPKLKTCPKDCPCKET